VNSSEVSEVVRGLIALVDSGVGDAIGDLADIVLEMRAVAWLWDHVGEADALWQLHFGFETHWGTHLRSLQWFVHALARERS